MHMLWGCARWRTFPNPVHLVTIGHRVQNSRPRIYARQGKMPLRGYYLHIILVAAGYVGLIRYLHVRTSPKRVLLAQSSLTIAKR